MTNFMKYNETLDSRDIIERITELEDMDDKDQDEKDELKALLTLAEECEGVADWEYGETLINAIDFESYMDEMVNDCYDLPKLPSFMTIELDYVALSMDYMTVTLGDNEYMIRYV